MDPVDLIPILFLPLSLPRLLSVFNSGFFVLSGMPASGLINHQNIQKDWNGTEHAQAATAATTRCPLVAAATPN